MGDLWGTGRGWPAHNRAGSGDCCGRGALRLGEHRSGCWITGQNGGKCPDEKMGKARKYSFKRNRKSFAVWKRTSLKVTAQFEVGALQFDFASSVPLGIQQEGLCCLP